MEENELYCYTCSIGFSSVVNLKEHNLSYMHHKVFDHQMRNSGKKNPSHHCFICNKNMLIDFWEAHIHSKRHCMQLDQMRSHLSQNRAWTPPTNPPHQARGRGGLSNRGRPRPPPPPPFRGNAWRPPSLLGGPPMFNPHFPPPPIFRPNFQPPPRAPASLPARSQPASPQVSSSPVAVQSAGDDDEMDVLLKRAQAMQTTFRKQRELAKKREEEEQVEKEKAPMKEVEAKLKKAEETNRDKMKGLIAEEKTVSSSQTTSKPVAQSSPKRAATTGPASLLSMISMPRSRRERRQVEDIIRKYDHGKSNRKGGRCLAAQRRPPRPKLQHHPSTSESEAVEEDVVETILRHEASGTPLPTIDLCLDEVTSGVTSLSDTARPPEKENVGENSKESARSNGSLLSPAPKKRRTQQEEDEEEEDRVAQSEEVTRMQMALELSVKEEGLRRRMQELDSQIDEQKVIMEAVLRRIEELETKKTKIRIEERAVHDKRMSILKESYAKVLESSASVTSDQADSSVVSETPRTSTNTTTASSKPSSKPRSRSVKQELVESSSVETPTSATATQDDQESEEEEEEPLIGNMTAREIRERAMQVVGGGAMSFGDLDDVINELMRVSNTSPDEVSEAAGTDTPRQEEEVAPVASRSSQKRRRVAEETDGSVVSDVMSARKSERSSRKRVSSVDTSEPRSGRRANRRSLSPTSSESSANKSGGDELSARSTSPASMPVFPGTVDGHRSTVHDMQLFRGHAFTCADDGSVKKFNLQTHACVVEYLGFTKSVLCLCVTEKPKARARLFSGGIENALIVHDVKTGTELQRLSMDAQIYCMTLQWFSLYLGLSNGVIVTYDVRKNRVIASRKVSSTEIRSLQGTKEGTRRVLVVASADGKIAVRDVNSGNHMHAVGDMEPNMSSLRLRVIHHTVYAAGHDGRLREFSLLGHPMTTKPTKLTTKVTSMFAQNNDYLLLGCQDGSVRIVDPENKTRVKVLYTGKRMPVTAVCSYTVDGEGAVVAGLKEGFLVVIHLTKTSVDCKFGACSLQFGSLDDLIYHVTRDHILSSTERDIRCLWENSCKHHFSMMDLEANEMHIRSHS